MGYSLGSLINSFKKAKELIKKNHKKLALNIISSQFYEKDKGLNIVVGLN